MLHRSWFLLAGLIALVVPLAVLPAPSAPAPRVRTLRVEVVFCLDTTGSMAGLLDGARRTIWAICNQILGARPTPDLQVGLVAYRDRGDDYVTRVYNLRDDLDAVYLDLRDLTASGGGDTPEHVNQALDDAVNKIKWSADKTTLKIVFLVGDAAPHTDYTDDVKYPVTCARAKTRGIVIHAVQCGIDAECGRHFAQIAEKAAGAHVVVPQSGGVVTLSTPFDKRLAEINAELIRNTIVHGPGEKRVLELRKLNAALALPAEAAADRAGLLGKTGRVARCDLIDAIRAGAVRLEDLAASHLDDAMRVMTAKQRSEHLAGVMRKRRELLLEAYELDRKRAGYLHDRRDGQRDTFDYRVLELLRKQAGRRLRF